MSPYTQEEIKERFARLPESLKEQMMSVENSERIFEAGKKFGFTIEQIGFLAEESGYVVLGLTHPNDFVARLKDHLHIDEEKAKSIAKEINHQVFFPLREILKTTHQFELTQEQIQAPPLIIPSVQSAQPPIQKSPPTPGETLPTDARPALSSDARSMERPAIQNENQPPIKETTPPAVPSVTSIPPIHKAIASPTTPPTSDIKPPAVPALIQPSTPQVIINSPTPTVSPQKPPLLPSSPIPTPIPQNVSRPPHTNEQGLTINLKTAIPISPPPSSPPAPQTESHPVDKPAIQGEIRPLQPPALQTEIRPMEQPTMSAMAKSIEGIKQKEPIPLSTPIPKPQQIPEAPLAPSQIMQKKLLEETKQVKIPHPPEADGRHEVLSPNTALRDGRHEVLSPAQTEVERMKESLFAPPSAPLQPKSTPTPVPQPPVNIPTPPSIKIPAPPPSNPSEGDERRETPSAQPLTKSSPSPARDPYREPID